jgi:type IV secretory pathway protease TraF
MKLATLLAILAAIPLEHEYVRWNASPSVPVGIYLRSSEFHRGDIVEVCARNAIVAEGLAKGYLFGFGGPCYRNSFPLVKYLSAVGGDIVDAPQGRIRLAKDQVFVTGTHPRSWDSRIFGPIPSSSVRARWSPLLTWKGY